MGDMQRDSGEPEAVRRQDGGGEKGPVPGSEAARANETPPNRGAGVGQSTETWTPGQDGTGVRPGSPAAQAMAGTAPADAPAEPDSDAQTTTGSDPQPASAQPRPDRGADASSHGSR